jgi:beta-lactam-binding protein with PASTA domain
MSAAPSPRLQCAAWLAVLAGFILVACVPPRPTTPSGAEIGELRVAGDNVFLNGRRASGGETIVTGDRVSTGANSSARIDFFSGGFVQLDENTDPEWQKFVVAGRCIIEFLMRLGRIWGETGACEIQAQTEKSLSLVLSTFHLYVTPERDVFTLLEGRAQLLRPLETTIAPREQLVIVPRGLAERRILPTDALRAQIAWTGRYVFGPAPIRVPDLRGLDLDRAERSLRGADLRLGAVDEQETPRERPGTVLEQRPREGAEVRRGTRVDVSVAVKPHEPEGATVPRLEGLSLRRAENRLRDADLRLGAVDEQETPRERPGTVLEQRPREGAEVRRGTRVDLSVAVEPREREDVRVPDLEGYTLAQARRRLEELGLQLGGVVRRSTGREETGTVIDQDPRPNRMERRGTRVDVTIEEQSVE